MCVCMSNVYGCGCEYIYIYMDVCLNSVYGCMHVQCIWICLSSVYGCIEGALTISY